MVRLLSGAVLQLIFDFICFFGQSIAVFAECFRTELQVLLHLVDLVVELF